MLGGLIAPRSASVKRAERRSDFYNACGRFAGTWGERPCVLVVAAF